VRKFLQINKLSPAIREMIIFANFET